MKFAIYPKYSNIYSGSLPSIQELLSGMPSESIIKTLCYINARKYLDFFDPNVDYAILIELIENLEAENRDQIIKAVNGLYNDMFNQGQKVTIFPLLNTLELIKNELVHYKAGNQIALTASELENLFKAIMVANETDENYHIKKATSEKDAGELETMIKWLWPIMLPTIEFQYRNEILLQIYYSIQFFKYLENDSKFSNYLSQYLKLSNCYSWQEYLKGILSFYISGFNNQTERFNYSFNKSLLERIRVIHPFIMEVNYLKEQAKSNSDLGENLKLIRERPIIKFPNNIYYITNWDFLVDKCFKSIKHDFFNFSGVKEIYQMEERKK